MSKKQDVEKARFWEGAICEAARSGVSVRAFCRRRKLDVAQFYWWRGRLRQTRPPRKRGNPAGDRASFALVSGEPGGADAGLELVLGDGRRLRICKGVDEETLRAVLAAVEPPRC